MSVYKHVLEACVILNSGEGGTPKEIFAFLQKTSRLSMMDEELLEAVNNALRMGISNGTLNRNMATGRYNIIHDPALPGVPGLNPPCPYMPHPSLLPPKGSIPPLFPSPPDAPMFGPSEPILPKAPVHPEPGSYSFPGLLPPPPRKPGKPKRLGN